MSDHKFKVDQTVSSTAGYFGRANMTDIYKIWQLLPPQGEDQQYRIKSANQIKTGALNCLRMELELRRSTGSEM